jgi:hypothetical protein
VKRPVPKPSFEAQADDPASHRVLFSDVPEIPKRPLFLHRHWTAADIGMAIFLGVLHAGEGSCVSLTGGDVLTRLEI